MGQSCENKHLQKIVAEAKHISWKRDPHLCSGFILPSWVFIKIFNIIH